MGTALSGPVVTSIRGPGRTVAASHGARPGSSLRQLVRQGVLLVVAAVAVLVALVLWIGGEKGNRAGV